MTTSHMPRPPEAPGQVHGVHEAADAEAEGAVRAAKEKGGYRAGIAWRRGRRYCERFDAPAGYSRPFDTLAGRDCRFRAEVEAVDRGSAEGSVNGFRGREARFESIE